MLSCRQKITRALWLLFAAALTWCVFYPVQVAYYPVPPWVVAQVPARMKQLQPGMTREQVWAQLGLVGYDLGGEGSGPSTDYREGYRLWPGYGILLVFDHTAKPQRFKRAELGGRSWGR